MNDSREITISPLFRILAGLLCLIFFLTVTFATESSVAIYNRDAYSRLSVILMVPLFLYCAIVGKVPHFITQHVSDEAFHDLTHAEELFTRFNAKSITAAIVFLTMVFYSIFRDS